MATVTRESIGTLHEKINVKVSKEDFMPSFEKALRNYAKNANVPGFRKGMVPAGMVKKMYGQSVFNEEIIRSASSKLEDYLREEKLAIFAKPMLMASEAPVQLNMDAPVDVDFSFEIGVKPTFDIPALNGNKTITKYSIEVSDKMVDDEVARIALRYGQPEDKDTIEKKDDIIYCTFELCNNEGHIVEGTEKIEDTAMIEKYPAQLQEMLMGKKAGDHLVIRPIDICNDDELANFLKDPLKKDVSAADYYFKLTITKVALLIPAELNETLFAQVFQGADVKDEATFKNLISVELGREYGRITHERANNEIYETLVHETPFEIPVTFLKRWLKEGQEKLKTDAEVEKEFPSFEHQLRWTLISDKLIVENKINVSLDEVNADIKARVLAYFGIAAGEEAPWMEGYMQKIAKDEKTLNETYQRIMFDRLFQFLQEKFNVTEQSISEENFFKLQDPHAAHHHHHHHAH